MAKKLPIAISLVRLGLIAWKPREMLKLDRTNWHCARSTTGSQKGVGTTRQLHALSKKDARADQRTFC